MQLLSLLVHGLLVLLILLAPWPDGYAPMWLVLVTIVMFGFIRSQRSIKSRHGEVVLLSDTILSWRHREWRIVKRPWLLKNGVLLSLQSQDGKDRKSLWLASDSMGDDEWRHLRQILLQKNWVR
ncbi:toxin CptA [Samsonia erythrinae]|uniref:Toxin CptA n=2 Tax=Samsonia erythrinae TaxID=160434 RepID=A0A4R3VQZ2_9GAMM|nr:toxin CptA [Samsonia erythrinae]